MKFIIALLLLLLPAPVFAAGQTDYDPGFGDYDPNRICYQAWCYMGDTSNEVGSVKMPHNSDGGIGLGANIGRYSIQFMELPFPKGHYRILANLITNRGGRLVSERIYDGGASYRGAVLTIPFDSVLAQKFRKGRFFKVYIFRNNKIYSSATFPLYGFGKAYRHLH